MPANDQSNKERYTALIAEFLKLTYLGQSVGQSGLLRRFLENIKHANNNTDHVLDHHLFATAFFYLLIKQHPDIAEGIIRDPKNQGLLQHLRTIKELDNDALEEITHFFNQITHTKQPKNKGRTGK